MKNLLLSLALVILMSLNVRVTYGQTKIITGKITNPQGMPVVATISVPHSVNYSTSSDEYGLYQLTVPSNADSLRITALGYISKMVFISGSNVDIQLIAEDNKLLDEVVVIGYGTQRKGDLTAPIATVNMDNMVKRTVSSSMDALQGSLAGVQIVSSGAPGASPSVRIRGVGSFNNENPLYVVDGMFMDDINFLNPNDIADMSVLKDASGAAIYGVRAANGVIIVTTKKGIPNMKTRVNYSGYAGFQMPTNILKMADGSQYAAFAIAVGNQSIVDNSITKFGGANGSPSTNTNWYDELLRANALIHNHNLDFQGGSDKITYAFGLNFLNQDGIMDAKNYERKYNIRSHVEAKLSPWIKLGFTGHLNNFKNFSPNSTAFRQAYFATPLYPSYDPSLEMAEPIKFGSSTSLGMPSSFWFNNPLATAYYNHNATKGFQILPSVYLEAQFWDDKLTFRSQLNQRYQSTHNIQYTPVYYIDNDQRNQRSYLRSGQGRNTNYILDNLLTYRDQSDKHHWTVLLGQSTREERWRDTWVSANDVPQSEEFWYVGQGAQGIGSATGYGENGTRNAGVSIFTRGTYDYDNKYLLTATFRADGSSKYQTKWGYFPSVGLGWVISKEHFMEQQSLVDLLKIRGSWGLLGNDGIQPNAGYGIVNSGNNFSGIFGSVGSINGVREPGYRVGRFFTQVRWEVVEEWDAGLDFTMLANRLDGTLDYYYRKTKDLAFSRPIPFMWDRVYGNWGSVSNSGWELTLNWKDKVGNFNYSLGTNFTTLTNKVLDIGAIDNIQNGFPEWTAEFPTRIEVGEPINYYYGYEVAGVYQNQNDIAADKIASKYNEQNPGAPILPGYLKYKDQNNNGELDEADRINLGNYLPKLAYGFNLGMGYKNIDLSVVLQGVAGNKIHNLNRAMRRKYPQMNADAAFIEGLWTAEGSTNSSPSAQGSVAPWNLQASSFFVESGAYLRIQNIQVGYNFNLNKSIPVRLYITADRPAIFTKYNGFTPEVSGMGFDTNVYPVSSTYSLGFNVTF